MNDINELKCYGDYISFENGADEQSLRSAILILKQLFNSRVKPIFGEEIIFGNSDENEIKIYPLKDGEIERAIESIYKQIVEKDLKKFTIAYKYFGL